MNDEFIHSLQKRQLIKFITPDRIGAFNKGFHNSMKDWFSKYLLDNGRNHIWKIVCSLSHTLHTELYCSRMRKSNESKILGSRHPIPWTTFQFSKDFCKEKNTADRLEWQPTKWENISINSTSDRGWVSKM